jgi:hypothetical protein
MSSWDSHWFYCRVPSEQLADVRGKGRHPLKSMMTPLDYLVDTPFEYSQEDANVSTLVEVTLIIGGRDAVEEFLACSTWPLSDSCEF